MNEKTSAVEKYLLKLIEANKNAPGYKLPSENTLCRIFGVSRQVVHPLLEKLRLRNLIYKVQGRGSFVSLHAADVLQNYSPVKVNLIAVILPDLSNVFMQTLLQNLEKQAYWNKYSILVFNSEFNEKKELECIQRAASLHVKGFIIYLVNNNQYTEPLNLIKENRIPAVFIDAKIHEKNYVSVCSNNLIDVENATNQLIHLGHKHIGIICSDKNKNSIVLDRISGYRSCLKSFDIPFHKAYLLNMTRESETNDWFNTIEHYLLCNKKLTAILALSSSLCLKTIEVLKKLKKRIPNDISLIGYEDDFSNIIDLMSIRLTAIKQNLRSISETAMQQLISLMMGYPAQEDIILISSEFIIRDSVKSIYR
mgnify:CR=1 FL=1